MGSLVTKSKICAAVLASGACLGLMMAAVPAQAASVLDAVKGRGEVRCGVSNGLLGFSEVNAAGQWEGLDVDVCRAVAAAVFGDASKVSYTKLLTRDRFNAVADGQVDILSRNTTWTLLRDSQLGITFTGVNFFDGQGFLIRKDVGVQNALELSGAGVCVEAGTTTELNLVDFFNLNRMDYRAVVVDTADDAIASYAQGRCDVYTSDRSTLAGQRTTLPDPESHMLLPDVISQEPLGPSVKEGDDQWADIVRWSLYAMLAGEALGVTSENVEALTVSAESPEIRRLLGVEGSLGEGLGLPKDWAFQILKQVGNYDQSFERNVGADSALGLERGLNALWTNGGLMYPMPIR
ncbi:MAG: amino acid ABC transporter substrate-binding protein [Rhodospirillaceae bacterium]